MGGHERPVEAIFYFVLHEASVLGHEIPSGFFSEIDGCNGWNLYPACKHGNVALTHTVRRELAAIKAPIRITVSSRGFRTYKISSHEDPCNFELSSPVVYIAVARVSVRRVSAQASSTRT